MLERQGKLAEVVTIWREAVDSSRQLHGSDHADVATNLSWLAIALRHDGRNTEAETAARDALAIWDKLGQKSTVRWSEPNGLATQSYLLHMQARWSDAEEVDRMSVEIARRHYPESVALANALRVLVDALLPQGKYA